MCFVLLMGVDLQTCIVYRCARHNSHQLVWVCSHAIVDSPMDISCTVWLPVSCMCHVLVAEEWPGPVGLCIQLTFGHYTQLHVQMHLRAEQSSFVACQLTYNLGLSFAALLPRMQ